VCGRAAASRRPRRAPRLTPPPPFLQAELHERRRQTLAEANIAAAAASAKAGARLTKETPFLATLRFTNALPPVPTDPKSLARPLDLASLAAFAATSLESGPLRDAPLGGCGVSVNLLTPEAYTAPARPPRLDPADAALLRAAAGGPSGGVGGAVAAEAAAAARGGGGAALSRPAAAGAELSWLMRTTYVTTDAGSKGVRGGGGGAAAPSGRAAGGGETDYGALAADPAALAAAVEATFAAAALPPVHPTNPAATPVSIKPFLPDLDAAGAAPLVLLTIDADDPLADAAPGALPAGTPRAHRDALAAAACTKSFLQAGAGGVEDRFVAYMVPRPGSATAAAALAAAAAAPGALPATTPISGDYIWAREFKYAVTSAPPPGSGAAAVVVDMGRSDVAPYVDVSTRLALMTRKRGDPVPSRPAGVTLEARARTEAEVGEAAARAAAARG
jgi:hypothetical protein